MCYFSPRKKAWCSGNFFIWRRPIESVVLTKALLPSLWKGGQYEWNRGIHYATFWHYRIPMIVPQTCVMNASVSFMLSSCSKWGQLYFCQHNGTPSHEKFPLLQACLRGGGGGGGVSTFWKWHCLRKMALESKRLIHTWWTWCQITLHTVKINGIQSRMSLKLRIKVVAFFLGHPV